MHMNPLLINLEVAASRVLKKQIHLVTNISLVISVMCVRFYYKHLWMWLNIHDNTHEAEKPNAYQIQILAQAEYQWIQDSAYWPVDGKLQHVTTYMRSSAMPGVYEPFSARLEHPSFLIWRMKKNMGKKLDVHIFLVDTTKTCWPTEDRKCYF